MPNTDSALALIVSDWHSDLCYDANPGPNADPDHDCKFDPGVPLSTALLPSSMLLHWPRVRIKPGTKRPVCSTAGAELRSRPWWGATLFHPDDVHRMFAAGGAADGDTPPSASVSTAVRDRGRLTTLPSIMTDFRKVSGPHPQA